MLCEWAENLFSFLIKSKVFLLMGFFLQLLLQDYHFSDYWSTSRLYNPFWNFSGNSTIFTFWLLYPWVTFIFFKFLFMFHFLLDLSYMYMNVFITPSTACFPFLFFFVIIKTFFPYFMKCLTVILSILYFLKSPYFFIHFNFFSRYF